jgi:integrase
MGTVTALAMSDPDDESAGRKRRKAKRNVNGEGNIRQRSDGRWEGRAYVITTDGREVRRSVYGTSWEDVHEKLTRLQADTMSGKRIATTSQTVGEYLTYWLAEHARHRVRATTYRSYEQLVRLYLIPLFGNKKLARLRPGDIRRGLLKLKQTCQCCAQGKDQAREDRANALRAKRAGMAPRKNARPIAGARCCARQPKECCRSVVSDGTVRYLHRLLRAALHDAVTEDELLTENVAKRLRMDHKYRPKFTPWTADEAKQFLRKAPRDHRWYALYAVALMLGLRRGEVLGLRWLDVDFERATVRVRHGLTRVEGELRLGLVKTDGSARLLPLPRPLADRLRAHQTVQKDDRIAAGRSWRDSGHVFTISLGTPIEPRNVNRHFASWCELTGVRRIRFHDLRHSCASLLYSLGVPLDQIQDILGHGSPVTTKLIYVDVAEDMHRDALDQLGALFEDGQDE